MEKTSNNSPMRQREAPIKPVCALALAIITGASIMSSPAVSHAQSRSTSILLEEIIVTARKREESVLDVPLSISAFSSEQLDVLKVRDIQSLSVGLPNVAFDDIGTTRGVANFSIRGIGVNSSIPSIDPTVGTFIDGVYLGTNAGTVFDVFDLESIEVLRGPQGTLFGRNVTGGAVLLNTKLPGDEFEGKAKFSYEGGGEDPDIYAMATFGGPVTDTLGLKLSVYTNQDDGYFKNLNTGEAFGEQDTLSLRPSLVWRPSDTFELAVRYEYFDSEGDGPASQNHRNGSGIANAQTNFDRNSLDFSIDEEGFIDTRSDFLNVRADWILGNGTITNIFAYRDLVQSSNSDIDATPLSLFHARAGLEAEQISNELRYTGDLSDKTKLTAGLYYFKNELLANENRRLLGLIAPPGLFGLTQDGGGDYEVETKGLFVSLEHDFTERLTVTAGARYTDEDKKASIASLVRNINSPCSVIDGTCPFDFVDDENWSNVSPKLGFTYDYGDSTMFYGHVTRGYRSGGYNLRNTAIDTVNFGPGPFDEESVDNIEFGFKTSFANGGRISGSLFYNKIKDMQREINLADPIAGVVQVIRNVADAEIPGLELEGLFPLSDRLLLNASLGLIDPEYDVVTFDLNSDGVLNDADRDLDLPRAAKITYSIGLIYDLSIGSWGNATSRVNYAFRDESAYTDNNLGFINEQGILDAGVDFYSDDGTWQFGIFAKNLTDEVKHGGDTQLPALLGPIPLGGTFSPLAKGRIIGVDVTYNF
ncbi:MAG: TonB-dependent receptor [Arenicella sp.]|nr:TonB-dependent receptor [Arenicella sp.]